MARELEVAKSLNKFFNKFTTAYLKNLVPEDAKKPYLTYNLEFNNIMQQDIIQVAIYTEGASLIPIIEIVEKISSEIGEGVKIPYEGGNIVLYKGDPYFQAVNTEETFGYMTIIKQIC